MLVQTSRSLVCRKGKKILMNVDGDQETQELRGKLALLYRKLQKCEENINWTEARRSEVSTPVPFQIKFFYELNEAYQREKRELAAEISRVERLIRERTAQDKVSE